MSQHTELIAKLRKFANTLAANIMTGHDHPNSQDELDKLNSARFLREAADALQAMERVPMTRVERRSAFLALDNPSSYDDFMTGLDTAEAHHNITPPESK